MIMRRAVALNHLAASIPRGLPNVTGIEQGVTSRTEPARPLNFSPALPFGLRLRASTLGRSPGPGSILLPKRCYRRQSRWRGSKHCNLRPLSSQLRHVGFSSSLICMATSGEGQVVVGVEELADGSVVFKYGKPGDRPDVDPLDVFVTGKVPEPPLPEEPHQPEKVPAPPPVEAFPAETPDSSAPTVASAHPPSSVAPPTAGSIQPPSDEDWDGGDRSNDGGSSLTDGAIQQGSSDVEAALSVASPTVEHGPEPTVTKGAGTVSEPSPSAPTLAAGPSASVEAQNGGLAVPMSPTPVRGHGGGPPTPSTEGMESNAVVGGVAVAAKLSEPEAAWAEAPALRGVSVLEGEEVVHGTEGVLTKPRISLSTGAACLPHPAKVGRGGEDAFFVNEEKGIIGLADGVGGWSQLGVDSGLYSRMLMFHSERLSNRYSNPATIITKAHGLTSAVGSTTALVVKFDGMKMTMKAANLGDSGFLLVRDGKVELISEQMQHAFNFPYQIGSNGGDDPKCSKVYEHELRDGDILVAGTDGLFDNVFEKDLAKMVAEIKEEGATAQEAADKLAHRAQSFAANRKGLTPFAVAAQAAGYIFQGGKMDDITVLVTYINETKAEE